MITELLEEYGSLKNIPDAELKKIGMRKVRINGGYSIEKIGAVHSLVPMFAELLETEQSYFKKLSAKYLWQFRKVLDVIAIRSSWGLPESHLVKQIDEKGIRAMFDASRFDLLERDQDFLRFKAYVQACASKDGPTSFLLEHPYGKKRASAVSDCGIDMDIWTTGITEHEIDIEKGENVSRSEILRRISIEFSAALIDLVDNGFINKIRFLRACNSVLGEKNISITEIIALCSSREKSLKKIVALALDRAARKNALKVGWDAVGLFHLQSIQRKLSNRGKGLSGKFEIRLSKKDVFTDITLGNDSGCCIGIYMQDEGFNGGVGDGVMWDLLIDPAVQFLELWHGRERCGLALLFASTDKWDNPVMVVNSIELSSRLEGVATPLVTGMNKWLCEFAKAAGFEYQVMGVHNYNTGYNYGMASGKRPVLQIGLRVIDEGYAGRDEGVYGDVIDLFPNVHGVARFDELGVEMHRKD